MLQLSQCKLPYKEATRDNLIKKIVHTLHILPEDIQDLQIIKKSLDARKKPDIFAIYTLRFFAEQEERIWKRNQKNQNLSLVKAEPSLWDSIEKIDSKEKVIVVGAGPAGLFCGYYLSLCGMNPVLIERGAPMEERVGDVEKFWTEGVLDSNSNVSFGEGGAGTFSDGKLNTGVKDRTGRKQFVLENFVKFGAQESICYDSHPHIGTDVLRKVIVSMRREMEQLGCTFLFHTSLLDVLQKREKLTGILTECKGEEKVLPCDRLVLAIGHSARDTFFRLYQRGMVLTPKPFAVGVRVQHPQREIDLAQYGVLDEMLPPSPYKLTGKTSSQRGVYSFCMCPGGYVVNASSEPGMLVVNGMSNEKRDSGYANSAIVVTVSPEDFPGNHPLAGVEFQRKFEKQMFSICQGRIPVQRYGDFVNNRETRKLSRQFPCVKGQWQLANLRQALPKFVVNGMIEGMEQFGRKIHGFDEEDALLLGFESRTSSPVRMERDEDFQALAMSHVYPCGEGAGYAGGIMSAAMDGLRVAMKIQEKLQE